MDYKTELAKIEKVIQERKLEKAVLAERLENLQNEEKDLTTKLLELGIEKIEDLPIYIEKTQAELNTKLQELKQIIGA